MKEDYEIKFWKDWLEGNLLKREKLVKNLLIVRNYSELSRLPKEIRETALVSMLNGFFEDLESAVYTKIRLEKLRK